MSTASDDSYTIHYTELDQTPITINEGDVDNSTDVTLFGRVKLEYGEPLDDDLLHLLENFACPEDSSSTAQNTFPDYTVNGNELQNPTAGQLWYNSTNKTLYYWAHVSNRWVQLAGKGSYAANWGQISDGYQIPAPKNPYTNQVYTYDTCIWAVSPANIPDAYSYLLCTTDNNANVIMKYRVYGDSSLVSGVANYIIINITGNTNQDGEYNSHIPLTPLVSPTPTPTITSSVTITPTHTITPTISITPTPVVSPTSTPSSTPAPSHSRTPSVTPTSTPSPSLSITPTPSPFNSACPLCTQNGNDCCVAIESFLPDGKLAGQIKTEDIMILADQETLEPATGKVSYSEPSLQPCVKLITENGASLICSLSAPIPTLKGLMNAPNVLNEHVATMVDNIASWSKVITIEDMGERWVQHITVENKCFWAGEQSDKFILHHNIKACYTGEIRNCTWVGPNCCECR